jgi:DNA anti-recombination protein RmuC
MQVSAEEKDHKLNGQIYAEIMTQMNLAKASLSQESQEKRLTLERTVEREIAVFKRDFGRDYAKTVEVRNLLQKQEDGREEKEKTMLEEYGLEKFNLIDKQNELQEQYEKKLQKIEETNAELRNKISREVEKLTEMISSQKKAFEKQLTEQEVRLLHTITSQKEKFEEQLDEQKTTNKEGVEKLTGIITAQRIINERELVKLTGIIGDAKKSGETSDNKFLEKIKSINDRLTKFNEKNHRIQFHYCYGDRMVDVSI